jgi:hypothetical protein
VPVACGVVDRPVTATVGVRLTGVPDCGVTVTLERGRWAVGCGAPDAGARGAGLTGTTRGTAGFSVICGPEKGVGVGGSVVAVALAISVGVAVGIASGTNSTTCTTAVGSGVGNGRAASAASSASTRCNSIVLPRPRRYPAQANKNTMATSAYCTRCQSVSWSYQKSSRRTRGG